jgi:hypothetical protein
MTLTYGIDVVPSETKRNMKYLEERVPFIRDLSEYRVIFSDVQILSLFWIIMKECKI